MLQVLGRMFLTAATVVIASAAFAAETAPPDPKSNVKPSSPTQAFPSVAAASAKTKPAPAPNRAVLEAWYRSDFPRGDQVTPGDVTLHIRSVSNQLPLDTGDGSKAIICSGAGCPIKVPFVFSAAHLRRIKSDMAAAQAKANCVADTAKCEMIGLKAAATTMEKMVHNEKLMKLSLSEQQAYSVVPEDEVGKATLQDCVDQTTNGITYLYVLAQKGLMRHYTLIEPGADGIHHWTRIKSDQGQIYAFDLYHRGEYGIPPEVSCENCQ
jgi:hypothetical protein